MCTHEEFHRIEQRAHANILNSSPSLKQTYMQQHTLEFFFARSLHQKGLTMMMSKYVTSTHKYNIVANTDDKNMR